MLYGWVFFIFFNRQTAARSKTCYTHNRILEKNFSLLVPFLWVLEPWTLIHIILSFASFVDHTYPDQLMMFLTKTECIIYFMHYLNQSYASQNSTLKS